MMTDLVEKLRLARQKPHVALQDYNILRSKVAEDLICVFEGHEDHPYYDTIFRRVTESIEYRPLVVNGKDQVLGLRELLFKRETPADKNVAYFIDKDFDGYKHYQPSESTYCTHGYSIENNLCSISVLRSLLAQEYGCYKTHEENRIDTIVNIFEQRLVEFTILMRKVNRAIYFARKNNIRLQGITNQIAKYINVDIGGITASEANYLELIGWPKDINESVMASNIPEFDALLPSQDWRGKFVMGVYVELLHQLKDDRCSDSPRHFMVKNRMKFNPKGDIIRTLALLSPIPQCLRSFAKNLSAHQKSGSVPV